MQVFKFNRGDTGLFDQQQVDLVYHQERFLPFIYQTFSSSAFDDVIEKRSDRFSKEDRSLLVDGLIRQYQEINISGRVEENILALRQPETYTITTGHQLSLFTGPLYFVVKILHAIRLCERLSELYPSKHFVPVYWMASEDHDFAEIDHLKIFNREIRWEHGAGGPVGRFDLNGMEAVREELRSFFAGHPDSEIMHLIENYDGNNLTEATRSLVHRLFSSYGLVIIDGDQPEWKSRFSSIMQKEITSQFSYKAVQQTNQLLQREGIRLQVNPREINLFYMKDGFRERIVQVDNEFTINGVGSYSQSELLDILCNEPAAFSPNVVLRPLYQEMLLPNLAYIGGAGEISYWLQLKGVFDEAGIAYPLIQVRNSILWMEKVVSAKKDKFDLQMEDLFKPSDRLKREYIEANEAEVLDFDELESAKEKYTQLLSEMILQTDGGLARYCEAELSRINNQLDGIKSKLVKAAKGRHDEAMKAIDFISERLFPNGGLQERQVNFFHFCPQGNVSERLDLLYSVIDPFEKDLIIIREV